MAWAARLECTSVYCAGALADSDLNVVFGGSGALGSAVVRALVRAGRPVRVISRRRPDQLPAGVDWAGADAADVPAATRACGNAAVVFHCAAAPYTDWPRSFPPILRGIIEAAAGARARLIYGDNLYMYGPVDGPIHEGLPAAATGRKGRVRAAMADTLLQADRSGRVRVAIGRAADFYGPGVVNSVLGDRVFGAIARHRPARLLGNVDAPHSFMFIDDFARGLLTLSEREEALGQVWHIPSAPPTTARMLVAMACEAAGVPPRLRVAPRALVAALSLVHPTLRQLRELRYSFERSYVVDHTKFERAFGAHPTRHADGVHQTMEWFRQRGAPS
jgi:nucleoside-diphosphate-sugar epimerase